MNAAGPDHDHASSLTFSGDKEDMKSKEFISVNDPSSAGK